VCSILWNPDRDTYTVGQWLGGRIYERRSDLSPDGRHLIYFAMNGKWSGEARGSWTAISLAPYLKAKVLYPKGDCWQGGGLFTSNQTYWLNGCHQVPRLDESKLKIDHGYRPETGFGAECPGVYFNRLQRDGWTLADRIFESRLEGVTIFEKPLPNRWTLRKYAHQGIDHPQGTGCYWDEHELESPTGDRRISCPKWEWADLDRDTLVYAQAGVLSRTALTPAGIGDTTALHDFGSMKFEPLTAPY
jgi:hypothetical protein